MHWVNIVIVASCGIVFFTQLFILYKWQSQKELFTTTESSLKHNQQVLGDKIEKTFREETQSLSRSNRDEIHQRNHELHQLFIDHNSLLRQESEQRQEHFRNQIISHMEQSLIHQKERLLQVDLQLLRFSERFERSIDDLRTSLNQRVDHLVKDNQEKLELIRQTVDEKLQGTLEKRLGESFMLVSSRLEQVHKGLGEMHSLAQGVGDLKRVLVNVKSRGGFAEVQLGMLLEQFLHTEQYQKNVQIKPSTKELVEYALKLPGSDNEHPVWLPIDAKFPLEDYERITDAAEKGDTELLEKACLSFEQRIKNEGKRIYDKYIEPPLTTDFAILYLATEGLYAEALRRPGLASTLQQNYRVLIVGPMTLGALLNSLQMGFKTLALQKRSSEVWEILSKAKKEFLLYGEVIDKIKKQLLVVNRSLEEVDVRNRVIERKLRQVESASSDEEIDELHSIIHPKES